MSLNAGDRFNRLSVVELSHKWKHSLYYKCVCDCGGSKTVQESRLRCGRTKSCGCLARETTRKMGQSCRKHGRSYTPVYIAWRGMLNRCYRPDQSNYHLYGGRGITVCERWRDVENFVADMGEPPPGHTLDRIDPEKNYEPGNCRWATWLEQGVNKRNTRRLEFQGEALTAREWADRLGLAVGLIRSRITKGWPAEKALTQPVSAIHSHPR